MESDQHIDDIMRVRLTSKAGLYHCCPFDTPEPQIVSYMFDIM